MDAKGGECGFVGAKFALLEAGNGILPSFLGLSEAFGFSLGLGLSEQ
jgi:hypothetical protein